MTKAITGEQRELVSSVEYHIPKFHGMTHYPHLIKKFGTPINFFGGFLESFLKEKLKRGSKQVNGHTHCLQHDLLWRSYEGRQYSLVRKVLFPSVYTMSLLVSNGGTDTVQSDESEFEDTNSINTRKEAEASIVVKPKQLSFSAEKEQCGIWYISGGIKQLCTQRKRSDGTVYYRLFHPDNEHGKPAVQNLVNSAVQRCKDKNSTETTSVETDRISFYYHVTIISKDDGTKTILRCNPKWNKQDKSLHQSKSWFDWVEVNWESRNGKNYSVPAKLLLWGNVVYSDGTETLLASIRSLRSTTVMPAHHRMFFATGDYICDEKTGLSVVEHNNILSTAFVVPALAPATISKCMSTQETVEAMENTDYYIALPPRNQWKLIGWDIPLRTEK